MKNIWEITDNNGIIHSGTQEEMELAFDVMCNDDEYSLDEITKWKANWEGDLKLIEVHHIYR